jgi:hypothetical protein
MQEVHSYSPVLPVSSEHVFDEVVFRYRYRRYSSVERKTARVCVCRVFVTHVLVAAAVAVQVSLRYCGAYARPSYCSGLETLLCA